MNEVNDWVELKDTLRLNFIWAVVMLFNSAFLTLWVAIQWVVSNKVVTPLKPTGLDQFVFTFFQVMFAFSSLAPVAITIYKNIRLMVLRTQRRIHQELEIGGSHEAN